MPVKKTEVLYDVKQAVSELKKLDKKVRQSEKISKKGLEAPGVEIRRLGAQLRSVNPKMGAFVRSFGKLGLSTSAVATGLGATAAAIGVTVANIVGFANALRQADSVAGSFLERNRQLQAIDDAVSSRGDDRRNFQFEENKDRLATKRLALTQQQIDIDTSRETARRQVDIEKDKLRQIEAARKTARKKTLDAEKRLAEKRAEGNVVGAEFSNRPSGRQVVDLTAKARQEAQKGNIDAAEALLEKAKELSSELGDHTFFTSNIDAANKEIVRALEKQVKSAKKEENTLGSKAKAQQANLKAAQNRLAVEEAVSKELANQIKLLGALSGAQRRQQKAERRFTEVEQGIREVNTGRQTAVDELNNRISEGPLGRFLSNLGTTLSAARSPLTAGARGLSGPAGELGGAQNELLEAFKRFGERDTRENIDNLAKEARESREILKRIRTGIEDGTKSPALEKFATRLEAFVKAAEQINNAGGLGPVAPGESLQEARDRLAGDADQAQADAAKLGANITINANIQGGVFDADAIKGFNEVLRREVRKEVARQGGNN